jgi:hypothetical protein
MYEARICAILNLIFNQTWLGAQPTSYCAFKDRTALTFLLRRRILLQGAHRTCKKLTTEGETCPIMLNTLAVSLAPGPRKWRQHFGLHGVTSQKPADPLVGVTSDWGATSGERTFGSRQTYYLCIRFLEMRILRRLSLTSPVVDRGPSQTLSLNTVFS